MRGTLDALRFGVLSVQGVKSVEIQEFPNGIPGEVRLDIAYENPDDAEAQAAVAERVAELRPAGIRVLSSSAGRRVVAVTVDLVLSGKGVSGAELLEVTAGVEQRIAARLGGLAPVRPVRMNSLTAAALEDPRVADAAIAFNEPGGGVIETLTLDTGQVLDVVRPFTIPAPSSEQSAGGEVATVATVDLALPIHLEPGVTLADATEAIRLAVDGYLAGRNPSSALSVDGLAAAIRDDSRFGLRPRPGDRDGRAPGPVRPAPRRAGQLCTRRCGAHGSSCTRRHRGRDMSAHAEAIADRLPTLYRGGDLVRGLADVLGLQLEIVDEEARIIQRAHWFDTTVQLAEAGALGALLDIDPEPWQSLGEYRAWLHALRTARLDHGAVTGNALRVFVQMYAEAFESTNNVEALPAFEEVWPSEPVRVGHAFVENPPQTNGIRLGGPGAAEPLAQAAAFNGSLDPVNVSILLTGENDGEHVPVIANLTTGDALVYLDELRVGDRLWVRAGDDGSVTAELGKVDVTSKFRSVRRLTPGVPWSVADTETDVRALQLLPGGNDIWFLPVAHYGVAGLDRVLLALADLDLQQGRWDKTTFDHSLFYQDPGVLIDLVWTERLAAVGPGRPRCRHSSLPGRPAGRGTRGARPARGLHGRRGPEADRGRRRLDRALPPAARKPAPGRPSGPSSAG